MPRKVPRTAPSSLLTSNESNMSHLNTGHCVALLLRRPRIDNLAGHAGVPTVRRSRERARQPVGNLIGALGGQLLGPRRQHHDLRAERHALVEVHHVLIDHPNTTGRDALPDRPWLGGAVNTVERVLITLPQIHGAGAERIARAAGHPKATLQFGELPPKVGLARDHLLRRVPVGPFLLVLDHRDARPLETLTPYPNAVA